MRLEKRRTTLEYRKEMFDLVYHCYVCADTEEQFTDDALDMLNLTQVHNQYRVKYGIPFVEEIKEMRERYGLSAAKMSEVFGFGTNVYRLYEGGEMPTVANGRLIKLAEHPDEFKRLVYLNKHALEEHEYSKVQKKLHQFFDHWNRGMAYYERKLMGCEVPNIYNGFRTPRLKKVAAMVNFFAHYNKPFLTAMNKSYEWFENNVIYRVPSNFPGAGRPVYPGFLQHTGFVAMNPDRHLSSHYDYFLDLVRGDDDGAEGLRQFYDEYNAVLDLPAEYYLDTIRTVFQEHALPLGRWAVWFEGKRRKVVPGDIRKVALFTVEGELDDISGSGQTMAAHDLCTGLPKSMKRHLTAPGAGHYGIFSGRRWRESIYPQVREFIAANRQRAKLRAVA